MTHRSDSEKVVVIHIRFGTSGRERTLGGIRKFKFKYFLARLFTWVRHLTSLHVSIQSSEKFGREVI